MTEVELRKGKVVGCKGRIARVRELLSEDVVRIEYEDIRHAADGWVENPTEDVPIDILIRMYSRNDVKLTV